MTAALDGIARSLSAVAQRELGACGDVEALRALTGGATRTTYFFEARLPDGRRRFILQLSTASADRAASFTPKLSASQDAALLQDADALGVRVPRVCALLRPEDGLGDGHITAFVEGESLGRRIVHDAAFAGARRVLASQLGANLARIHRIDLSRHQHLVPFGPAAQIGSYAGIVEHYGVRSPALEYALAWSREHAPAQVDATVVHADYRMGNLLVGRDGLAAVLDWEAAHQGDPMQDLGYLCVRTWRFGGAGPVAGVGARDELFAAYEAAGGRRVDPQAVRFWEAWGNVKWALVALRKGLRHRDSRGPVSLEQCAIGRRTEEALWDFFRAIDKEHPG